MFTRPFSIAATAAIFAITAAVPAFALDSDDVVTIVIKNDKVFTAGSGRCVINVSGRNLDSQNTYSIQAHGAGAAWEISFTTSNRGTVSSSLSGLADQWSTVYVKSDMIYTNIGAGGTWGDWDPGKVTVRNSCKA